MTVQKYKIFKGEPEKLYGEINRWLSKLTAKHKIDRTETAIAVESSDGKPVVVVSLWYSELNQGDFVQAGPRRSDHQLRP